MRRHTIHNAQANKKVRGWASRLADLISLSHALFYIIFGLEESMLKRHTRAEQLRHIEAWRRSGLTKSLYCQQHRIAPHNFYRWLKIRPMSSDATAPALGAFIPVQRRTPDAGRSETVMLNLPNGCSVSCLPSQLMSVMQALSLC
ncbi:hypothetical protein [Sodalis sp. dw_96]|uniref:IS66 family insertion sequence element accessory protein TnpA n=1 Tax=Sodalis sp. dw_96 TaxID=2719794 RepID=UPI002107C933|nr:hypothetical protein [Sodalis sp. dw_96]